MAMDPLAEFQSATRAFRKDPRRMRLVMEGVKVLGRMAERLDERELRGLSTKGGIAVLLDAMEQENAREFVQRQETFAAARARGLKLCTEALESEGGTLGAQEVAEVLGISRQAVDQRRAAGKLLALDLGMRKNLYPRWQITEEGILAGLEEALLALKAGGNSPWMCLRFFLSQNYRLGEVRPLDLLRRGEIARVVQAASVYGEQGAT
jgi:hypothetical protein